jgi:translocation and assembly module TamB
MAEVQLDERKETVQTRRNPFRTALKWVALVALGLFALVGIIIVGLNTDPGRRLVADQLSKMEFANGMRVGVDRIEGSLYGDSVIHGLTLSDTRGVFFRAPVIRLDWRPFDYLNNQVDIRSLVAPTATLLRNPQFKATPPSQGPLLPDLDISIGRLRVDRLIVEAPVTGERRVGSIEGQARIADRRAQLRLRAGTIAEAKGPGGDRLSLVLDAVPEENRLALDLLLDAPSNGVLAKLAGLSEAVQLRVRGRGDWQRWNGQLAANLGNDPLARLRLTARDGTFRVQGPTRVSRLLTGPSAGLLGPIANIDLQSTWSERVAKFSGTLASDAFRLVTNGAADTGRSRLSNVRVNLALLRPGAVEHD